MEKKNFFLIVGVCLSSSQKYESSSNLKEELRLKDTHGACNKLNLESLKETSSTGWQRRKAFETFCCESSRKPAVHVQAESLVEVVQLFEKEPEGKPPKNLESLIDCATEIQLFQRLFALMQQLLTLFKLLAAS